ncbi:hypothetical protein GCM10009827_034360 [Dactylosporangium maewongense]|uniref:NACHT domain-containing protein n=1 Tax=Dactylosporangium maewongense TaxID=634393 RepID=A0ABN2AEC3_9ACTN
MDGRADPVSAGRRALVDLLARLKVHAGRPTLRQIAARLTSARDGGRPSIGHLSEIFRGRKTPSGDLAVALARALGGSADDQVRARIYADAAAQVARHGAVTGAAAVTGAGEPDGAGETVSGDQDGAGEPDEAGVAGPVLPWWRPDYAAHVDDLVPVGGLRDREAELAELAAFCAGDEPYLWIQAEPWAGKSALLATFVRHPQPGVDVLAFFVTARLATQSDSNAFAGALVEQLTGLLELRLDASAPAAQVSRWLPLLRTAARHAELAGRRLLLVVDGLDEDKGAETGSGLASVASLLPRHAVPNLRIVVSSRPDPPLPDDVPGDHPLRHCRVRWLTAFPHASSIAAQARQELRALLLGDSTHVDVIGLLTACADGLTVAELEELTGLDRFRLERLIGGVFGRSVAVRPVHASAPEPVLLFTHDELREQAVGGLGAAIGRHRERIHAWADGYRAKRWPVGTPQYLLHGYPRMLRSLPDPGRLIALAVDHDRHDRLLAVTGGDGAGMAEVRAAQDLIIGRPEPDLRAMVRLALRLDELTARNANIPAGLPALWVVLGEPARGDALAQGMADPVAQNMALAQLAAAVAGTVDERFAQTVAWSIVDAKRHERSLADLVETAVSIGDHRRAARFARSAIDQDRWTRSMLGLVGAVLDDGDLPLAMSLARSIIDPDHRALAMSQLLRAFGAAGDADQVERLMTEAETAAHAARDRSGRSVALARLSAAVRVAGRSLRAERLFTEALSLARSITDPAARSRTLAGLLQWGAPAPGGPGALAAEAAAAARTIDGPVEQAELMLELVDAVLAAGDLRSAETLGRLIDDPRLRTSALTRLLEHTARASATPPAADAPAADGAAPLAVDASVVDTSAADGAAPLVVDTSAVDGAVPLVVDVSVVDVLAVDASVVDAPVVDTSAADGAAPLVVDVLAVDASVVNASVVDTSAVDGAAPLVVDVSVVDVLAVNASVVDTSAADGAAPLVVDAPAVNALVVDGAPPPVVDTSAADGAAPPVVDAPAADGAALPVADPSAVNALVADGAAPLVVDASVVDASVVDALVVDALASAGGIGGRGARALAYAELAAALYTAGRPDETRRLAAEVAAAAPRIADPAEQAAVWIALIRLSPFTGAGEIERHVAAAHAAAGRLQRAQRTPVRAELMAELMAAIIAAGGPDRAERYAAALPDADQRAAALTQVGHAVAAAGDHRRAAALAVQAETAGRTVDVLTRAHTLGALTAAVAVTGRLGLAERLARSIPDEQLRAQALARLATTAARTGAFPLAEKLAGAVPDPALRSRTTCELAAVAAAAGQPDRAEAFVDAVDDPDQQAEARTQLAETLTRQGLHDRAQRVASNLADPFQRVLARIALMKLASGLGGDEAARLTTDVDAAIRELPHADERIPAMIQLVGAVLVADRVRAWRLTAEVRDAIDELPDEEQRAWLIVQLVEVLAANDEADRAEIVARAVADPGQRTWALVQLIETLAAAGETERAEAVAYGLDDPDERARALARLVRAGGAAAGRRAEAIAFMLPDPYRQAEAMTDVAASLAERGDHDRAEAVALAVSDPEQQSWALAQVCLAAIEAGDLGRAERLTRGMPVAEQRVQALAPLIAAVRAAGDPHRAEQLAAEAEAVVRTITQPDRRVQAVNALVAVVPPAHAHRLLAGSLGLSGWKQCLLRLAEVAAPVVLRAAEDYLDADSSTAARR